MLTNTEFQMFLDRMQQMVSPLEAQIQELTKQVEELQQRGRLVTQPKSL
jgi:prefoldin subunit 5